MNRAMNIAAVFTFLLLMLPEAKAQMMPWGTGMYGAMQSCPYQYSAAEGSSSDLDEIREQKKKIKDAERKLKEKKKQLARVEKDLERARRDIEEVIAVDFSDFLFEHMESGRTCDAYKGIGTEGEGANCADDPGCTQESGTVDVRAYRPNEWPRICAGQKVGGLNGGAACGLNRSRNPDSRGSAMDCAKGISSYGANSSQKRRLERDISLLERAIEDANDSISTAKENYLDEMRDRQTQTQGGFCFDCLAGGAAYEQEKRGPDWASVLSNGIVGGLAVYLGYQTNKTVSQNNAAMGWPSQPYNAMGAGYPFLQNALYGAMGGGIGQGAYGCAGGMNGGGFGAGPNGMMGPMGMGGLYGYPNGMQGGPFGMQNGMMGNPWGGGMYNPGMGPWGMNGPFGGMGMPMPGGYGMPMMGMPMGMAISGGIAMGGGMPMMGMQGMGMQMGGMPMMGMQGMGMQMGGMPMMGMAGMGMQMGGMPMMGMQGMGMQMGGMPMMGMQGMGMPMGMAISGGIAMGGGMPMMGMPGMGMAGMGMQMGGMPMMGMQMGGMPMMGMQMGGMPMMGMAGMGMQMGGMPMMGMAGMGMQMGGMDMGFQQQMMQMQQQQYQLMMQQQQRAQEAAMQRQQVVSGLQQELYGLVYRINQVQMGGMYSTGGYNQSGYLGTGFGGGSIGGSFGGGSGSGSIIQPAPSPSGR